MAVELKVPTVGESITEVQVGEWLVREGDYVERETPLASLETDKVTVELPAPVSGTLVEIRVQRGGSAAVGEVIGMMQPGEAPARSVAEGSGSEKVQQGAARGASSEPAETTSPAAAAPAPAMATPSEPDAAFPRSQPARVMPAARRALAEAGLAAADAEASGPGGRLLKEDVQRARQKHAPAVAEMPVEPSSPADANRLEEVVPMSPFRRQIARRLVEAQHQAALLTTFNEVDMSGVMELRKRYQPVFQQRYGIKLGFMSFFVKAAVEGLKAIPGVNAEIRGDDIVYRGYYDIGVAVGGGRGLVVPVIRNAEALGFAEVEQAIADFATRAKNNRLALDELQGGTFTISNGGIYGSMLSTPIVNPPQSGILGLHAIQERPVARDGEVVVRPMMYVALTYDHRLVDGREAVTFLKRIKECIEEPSRILLEV